MLFICDVKFPYALCSYRIHSKSYFRGKRIRKRLHVREYFLLLLILALYYLFFLFFSPLLSFLLSPLLYPFNISLPDPDCTTTYLCFKEPLSDPGQM
jgi:hypothetical protein